MVSLRDACRLVGGLGLVTLAACSDEDVTGPGPPGGVMLDEDFSGRSIFPPDNWWNLDVSEAPLAPGSQDLIDWLSGRSPSNPSATRRLHPDFGPPPYGVPAIGVSGSQPRRAVAFVDYPEESDGGAAGGAAGYPIPDEARLFPDYIEGAIAGGGESGDRHCLVIDRDRWFLYETWATRWNARLGRWEAGSGAVWDLATNDRRPDGWTSADAAGLAIFPGLVKYDEAAGPGAIAHAFRFTARATDGYVWPASHAAGDTPGAPPMGARLRLEASKDLSGYPPEIRRIFQAMKTHGLILADNGSDLFIQGTMDARWDNDVLNPAFHGLTADDFEVIRLGWNPVAGE